MKSASYNGSFSGAMGAGQLHELPDNDKTDLAQQAFSHMTESKGEPDLPELGVHMLVGHDILTKAYNLHRNLDEERVSLIETVVGKPDL